MCPGAGGDEEPNSPPAEFGVEEVQLEDAPAPDPSAGLAATEGEDRNLLKETGEGEEEGDTEEGGEGAKKEGDDDDDDEEENVVMSYLEAPWRFAFKYTVPDCGEPEWENWYMVTFVMCIV